MSIPTSYFTPSNCTVEVFKTNVHQQEDAAKVIRHLLAYFPHYFINFDLEDCDRILRVESPEGRIEAKLIAEAVKAEGYRIDLLE